MKTDIISKLASRSGKYIGRGINHEGQAFTGSFALNALLGGTGIHLTFKASGDDGTIFHEESTTIANDLTGEIGLYNLNTNIPGLVIHKLIQQTSTPEGMEKAVFAFGDRANAKAFREEITFELHPDGSIGYKYAWGMPSGEFADRSSVVMQKARS